ncbi:hypothetical protein ACTFIR_011816 [Dictyostelium discoideum]
MKRHNIPYYCNSWATTSTTATIGPTTFNTASTIGTSSTTDDTTAIDATNTIPTTDTAISTTTKKRRGRPQLLKEIPENCYVCRVTETLYFRKGTDEGVVVDLCNSTNNVLN